MRFLALWAFLLFICVQALLDEPAHNTKTTKPTFIVNLDSATVICQHSANRKDLHMHDLSILCNGKVECFGDQTSMNDENFPYCDSTCELDCSKHGACLLNGTRSHCYCNTGFYGVNCENYNPNSDANSKTRSKSLGVSQSKANAFAQVKANGKHKYAGEDKNMASDDAFEETSLAKEEQKKQLKINRQAQKQEGGYILLHNPSNSSSANSTFKVFDRKKDGNGEFETVLRRCNSNEQGCPENAECRNGNCECQIGFNWNPLSGRCEESRFDLNGQRFETSSVQGKRGGRFQTSVYGEWKNYTGGQLIISRGTFLHQPNEWGLELTGKMAGQNPQIIEEPDNQLKHKQTEQLSKSTHISTANLTTNALDSRRTNSPSPTLHKEIKIEEIQLSSNSPNNFLKKISTPRKIHSSVYNKSNQTSSNSLKESQQHGKQIAKNSHASQTNKGGFVALIKHPFINNSTSTTRSEATTPSIIDVEAVTKLGDEVFSTSKTPKEKTAIKPDLDEWMAEPEIKTKTFEAKADLTTPSSFDDWMINPEEQSPTIHKETESTFMPMSEDVPEQGLEIVVKSGEILFGTTTVQTKLSANNATTNEPEISNEKFEVTKSEADQPEHGLEIIAKSGAVVFESTTNRVPKDLPDDLTTLSQDVSTSSPKTMMEHGLEIIAKLGQIIFETTTKSPSTISVDLTNLTDQQIARESLGSVKTIENLSTVNEIKSTLQPITRFPSTLTTPKSIETTTDDLVQKADSTSSSKMSEQSVKDVTKEKLTESTTQSSKTKVVTSSTLPSKNEFVESKTSSKTEFVPISTSSSKNEFVESTTQPSKTEVVTSNTLPSKNEFVESTTSSKTEFVPISTSLSKNEFVESITQSSKTEVVPISTSSSELPHQKFTVMPKNKLIGVTTEQSLKHESDMITNPALKDNLEVKSSSTASSNLHQQKLTTRLIKQTLSTTKPSAKHEVVTEQPLSTTNEEGVNINLTSKMPERNLTTKLSEQPRSTTKLIEQTRSTTRQSLSTKLTEQPRLTTKHPLSTKLTEQLHLTTKLEGELTEVTTKHPLSTNNEVISSSTLPSTLSDKILTTMLEDNFTKEAQQSSSTLPSNLPDKIIITSSEGKLIEVISSSTLPSTLSEQKSTNNLKDKLEVTTNPAPKDKFEVISSSTVLSNLHQQKLTTKLEYESTKLIEQTRSTTKLINVNTQSTLKDKLEVVTEQPLTTKLINVNTKSILKDKLEVVTEQPLTTKLIEQKFTDDFKGKLIEVTTKPLSKLEVTNTQPLLAKVSDQTSNSKLTDLTTKPLSKLEVSTTQPYPKLLEVTTKSTIKDNFEVSTTQPYPKLLEVTTKPELKGKLEVTVDHPFLTKSSQQKPQQELTKLEDKSIKVSTIRPLSTKSPDSSLSAKLEHESIKSTTEQPLMSNFKVLADSRSNTKLIEVTTKSGSKHELKTTQPLLTKLSTSKSSPTNKLVEVTTDLPMKHGFEVKTNLSTKIPQKKFKTTFVNKLIEVTTTQPLLTKMSTSKSSPDHSIKITTKKPSKHDFGVTTKLPTRNSNPDHSIKITTEQLLKHDSGVTTTDQKLKDGFEVTTKLPTHNSNPDHSIKITTEQLLKHDSGVTTNLPTKNERVSISTLTSKMPQEKFTTNLEGNLEVTTKQSISTKLPKQSLSTKSSRQELVTESSQQEPVPKESISTNFEVTTKQPLSTKLPKQELTTDQQLKHEFEVTNKKPLSTNLPKQELVTKSSQQELINKQPLSTKLTKSKSNPDDESLNIVTKQPLSTKSSQQEPVTKQPLSTKSSQQDSKSSSESTQSFIDSSTTVLPERGIEIVAKSGKFMFESTTNTPSTMPLIDIPTNKLIEVTTQTESSTQFVNKEVKLSTQILPEIITSITSEESLQTRSPLNEDLKNVVDISTKQSTQQIEVELEDKLKFVSKPSVVNKTSINDQKLFNITEVPEIKSSLSSPTRSSVNVHPKDGKEVSTTLQTQKLEVISTVKPALSTEVETGTQQSIKVDPTTQRFSTNLQQSTSSQSKTSDQTTAQSLLLEVETDTQQSIKVDPTTQRLSTNLQQSTLRQNRDESKSSSIQTPLELSTMSSTNKVQETTTPDEVLFQTQPKSKENGLEISMIDEKFLPKDATTTNSTTQKNITKSNEVGLEITVQDALNSRTTKMPIVTSHTIPNFKSSETAKNDVSTQEFRTSTQSINTMLTEEKTDGNKNLRVFEVSTQRSPLISGKPNSSTQLPNKIETKDPWMIEEHTQSSQSVKMPRLNETTIYSSTITPSIQTTKSISTKKQKVEVQSTSLNLGDLIFSTQQPPLTTLESTIKKAPESTKTSPTNQPSIVTEEIKPNLALSTMHPAKDDVSTRKIPEWPTKITPIHTTRHKISEEWITTKSEEITNEPIILLKSSTTNQPGSTKLLQTVSIHFVPKSINVSVQQTTQLPTTVDDEELIRTDFVSTTVSSREASVEEQEMDSTKNRPDFSPILTTQHPKVEDHVYTDFSGESTRRPQKSTTTGKVNSVTNDATTSISTNIPTDGPDVEIDRADSGAKLNEERQSSSSKGLLVAGKDQLEVKPSTKRPGLSKIDTDELLRSELEENKSRKTEVSSTKSTTHSSSSTSFIQPEVLDFNKIGSSAPTHKKDGSSSEPNNRDNWVISVEDSSRPIPISSETIEVNNKNREVSEFHKSQKVKITNKTGSKVEVVSSDQTTEMPIDEDGLQINGQLPTSANVEVDELSGQKVEIDANGRKVKIVSGKSTKSPQNIKTTQIAGDGLQINGQLPSNPTSSESSSIIEIDSNGRKVKIVSGKSTKKSGGNVEVINGDQTTKMPIVEIDQTNVRRLEVDSNGHTIKTITKSTKESSGRIEMSTKKEATLPTDISQMPVDENGLQISGKDQPQHNFHPTSSELASIELEEMNTKKLEIDANGRKVEAPIKSTTIEIDVNGRKVKTVTKSSPNQTTSSPNLPEDVKTSAGPIDEQGLQISGEGQPQQNLQQTVKVDETNSKTTTPGQTKIEIDSNGNRVEVFSESKIISSGSKSGKQIEVTTSRRIITPSNGQSTQTSQLGQTIRPDKQKGLQINGQNPASTKLPNIEIDETNGQTIKVDETGQIVKNPNNLNPIDVPTTSPTNQPINELTNPQPGEHGLIIIADKEQPSSPDSPNIEVEETNGQTVEIDMHGSHKTSIGDKSSNQPTKQVTPTPLDDKKVPTRKVPTDVFVTSSPNSGPGELPEAEDLETTQPPQRTVHLVKNVERFQNGTLKYWSTLVPVQKTSTEQTPQELGIEITGEDLKTTDKPPTSSAGLEISGDDINPVQNQTGELGLVIEGATQSPKTTIKHVETLPSQSTTKESNLEVSTTSIPPETPSIIVDQTGPVQEHGLVIEHFANGWPEESETTTLLSTKSEPTLSSTSSPNIEIVTESSLSSQRPDDQLPKETSTIPVEEPITNTQEPLVLTADKQSTSQPGIVETSSSSTVNLIISTTQQSIGTEKPIELEKPLDESQAEFPQDGESTLPASKATSKVEQTTQSIETSTLKIEQKEFESTTVFNPPPEDQQTNKAVEEEDLKLQPNEFSTTKIVNELPGTTLKPIEVTTDSSSQTTMQIETSTLSSKLVETTQQSESSEMPLQTTPHIPEELSTETIRPDISTTKQFESSGPPPTSTSLIKQGTTEKDLIQSSTQKVELTTSKGNLIQDQSTESSTNIPEVQSSSTVSPKESSTESTKSSFGSTTLKEELIESSTNIPEVQSPSTTSKEDLIQSPSTIGPKVQELTSTIESTTSKQELSPSTIKPTTLKVQELISTIEPTTSKQGLIQSPSTIGPKVQELTSTIEPTTLKDDLIESSTNIPEVQSSSTVSLKDDLVESSTQSQSTISPKEELSPSTIGPTTSKQDLIQSSTQKVEPTTSKGDLVKSSTNIPKVQSQSTVSPKEELSSSTISLKGNLVESSTTSILPKDDLIESSTQSAESTTLKDDLIQSTQSSFEPTTLKEDLIQRPSTIEPTTSKNDLIESPSTVSPKESLIESSTQKVELTTLKEELIQSTQSSFEPTTLKEDLIQRPSTIEPKVQELTSTIEISTRNPEVQSQSTSQVPFESTTLQEVKETTIIPQTQSSVESTLKTSQNPATSTPINIDVLPEEPVDELKNEPGEILSTQPNIEKESTTQQVNNLATTESVKQELTTGSTTKLVEQTQHITEVPSTPLPIDNKTTQSPIEIASSTKLIVQESTTQQAPQTPKNPAAKNGSHCVSSDECGIDAFCEKTRAECLCKRGFTGSPSSCKDIDECALKIDGCHPSSQCHNYIGGFTCQCPIGYRMTSNGVCVDVDECSERNLTLCSPNAHCKNILGSYLCECKEGFNGDGLTCFSDTKRLCTPAEQLISETTRSHLCLVDSEGKVEAGECKHGYSIQYGVCIDINECSNLLTNQCSDKGVCVNTQGSYYCQCKSGFKGDGINCEDIDECKRNPCHPQATCINTSGNFTCSCPTGWKGDGIHSCINPLETICEKKSDICTSERNSDCLSMEVKRELASFCECAEGFRWNPKTKQCDDVNECIEQRSSCNTTTSFCVNKEGTYNCQCLDGFEGNDGICVDIDECHRNTHTCHQNAYCVNLIGSYECACAEGFSGNGEICFFDEEDEGQEDNPTCNKDWTNYCRSLNKTCFVDEEEILQCGSCMNGYHLMDGKCMPLNAAGNCADPAKNDCDMNAECIDVHPGNHLCVCKNGFIGDGIHCDPVDFCRIPGICDQNSICQNLVGSFKCICHPGFVLVGRKCEPIAEQSIKSCHQDKSLCHLNAECLHDGTCRCLSGYIGDGVSVCAPSQTQPPNDQPAKIPIQEQTYISGPISIKPPSIAPPTSMPQKVNPPSIRPPSIAPPSIAPTTWETTETSKPYKMVTMPQQKVTIRTTTPEAYQTPPPPTTTTPETYQTLQTTKTVGNYQKPGICSTCHQNAECISMDGAQKCRCHNGFYGDGHNCYRQEEVQPPLKVQCSADGIEVLLSEANKPFSGHVYVDGQKDNPYCSKTYTEQQASPTNQHYNFFIPISHCNMKVLDQNTLSATVIVQKHSTFITEQAYSYQVRCTYPLGTKLVESKFDVKDLESATEAAIAQKLQPTCKVEVTNLENIIANSATVGQVMKLVLSVQPNETYGIRPRNCFATNMETAERYRLTDENGCAFDTDLFPQWTQLTKARTQSIFRTFKWPDCRMIRFECDCVPCLDKCPEVVCSRKAYRSKRHLLRLENSTTDATRTAFSSVIYVREKQESEDAQREFEDWLIKDSKQDRRSTQTISSRLCFRDTWPLLIIVAGLLILAIASILFLFHRLAQVQKDEKKRSLRHAHSLGNLSSYIQF